MLDSFTYDTPIGKVRIDAEEEALRYVGFQPAANTRETPLIRAAYDQLTEYFSGTRREFQLPLAMEGTPFQMRVWAALREIPYGATRSYRDVAEAIGNVRAVRAVGMANHRNPISIIVPCHRVVGADGSLTGYGGGIEAKRFLLELERTAGI